MGLASALASQQGAAPPGQQQYHQQPQYGAPAQPQYGAPPGQYGAPQFHGVEGQSYGGPPASSSAGMSSVVAAKLAKIVSVNQLGAFYPPDRLQAVTARVIQSVDFHSLAARWRMPVELAVDLSALALYDVVIYADDSGSMESGDGERIEDLKLIVAKVAEVATLFDDDGIEVRFINTNVQGNHVKTAEDASRLLRSLEYRYDTKIGTQLEAKILRPMAYSKRLAKPLLIITVTDGEPSDNPRDKIFTVIHECVQQMSRAGYGPHAVAFQFAQVGRDQEAQEFLSTLDRHPQIGKMIDCTSYFEMEQAEYAKKGINLSVEAWLVKLMVGAIDPEYDEQDEGGAPPPQQPSYGQQAPTYGQPPGGYPPAQPGYGQPPGGYPQPQYQQQQYQQQQQKQQHGYPPQQQYGGGYPPAAGAPPGYPQGPGGYPQQQQFQQQKPPKKGFLDKLFG